MTRSGCRAHRTDLDDDARSEPRPRARLPLLVGPGRPRPARSSPADSAAEVWDFAGNRYLDFSSQLVNVNIGHQHPAVVAGDPGPGRPARDDRRRPRRTSTRGEAAQRILSKAPAGFRKVFFTNGGADANENAIRMARLHTGRDKVLSTYRSYHGNTGAAIVATGDWRRMPNEYARGHVHFFGPFLYRSEFWATTPEEESERALRHLERVIQSEGPATIAAILLETVPGHRRHPGAAAGLPRRRAGALPTATASC